MNIYHIYIISLIDLFNHISNKLIKSDTFWSDEKVLKLIAESHICVKLSPKEIMEVFFKPAKFIEMIGGTDIQMLLAAINFYSDIVAISIQAIDEINRDAEIQSVVEGQEYQLGEQENQPEIEAPENRPIVHENQPILHGNQPRVAQENYPRSTLIDDNDSNEDAHPLLRRPFNPPPTDNYIGLCI